MYRYSYQCVWVPELIVNDMYDNLCSTCLLLFIMAKVANYKKPGLHSTLSKCKPSNMMS